jgi:hypothetical protein
MGEWSLFGIEGIPFCITLLATEFPGILLNDSLNGSSGARPQPAV